MEYWWLYESLKAEHLDESYQPLFECFDHQLHLECHFNTSFMKKNNMKIFEND